MMRLCLALALVAASAAAPVINTPVLRMRGGGKYYPKLPDSVKPGVITGQAVKDLLQAAKEQGYAIPAVNCVTSSSINTVLEAARKYNSPVMIQFSNGGSQFMAGKSLPNDKDKLQACVTGAIAVRFRPDTPSTSCQSGSQPPICLALCCTLRLAVRCCSTFGKQAEHMYGEGVGRISCEVLMRILCALVHRESMGKEGDIG